MRDFNKCRGLDERAKAETPSLRMQIYVCSSTHDTEVALHDLNYPEMHRAEERKRFNRTSQSKNPLAQPLICTSSASEATARPMRVHTSVPVYSAVCL